MDELQQQWLELGNPPNWFDVYNWGLLGEHEHIDDIAQLLLQHVDAIILDENGLRSDWFRKYNHDGHAYLNDADAAAAIANGPLELNERRYVRALFNLGGHEPLGTMLDYELPLKEDNDARHGKVDLLSSPTIRHLLVCEVKSPANNESLLKAVSQAFTYTRLLAIRQRQIEDKFGFTRGCILGPAVVTHENINSGTVLLNIQHHPAVGQLLQAMNESLIRVGCRPMRFFIGSNTLEEVQANLGVEEERGRWKPSFRFGFVPTITELALLL